MKKTRESEGIALVIVLGFLAVLTLMAVSMAISMRTERLASSGYLDMVRARMYCNAALADSMLFLEQAAYHPSVSPTNQFMPNFQEYFLNTGSGRLPVETRNADVGSKFTEYHVLPSIESVVGDSNADIFTNALIDGIGRNFIPYIPGRYWRAFIAEGSGTDMIQGNAQWLHVTNSQNRVVGRFMYVVINTSGRVDINYLEREQRPSRMKTVGTMLGIVGKNLPNYQLLLNDRDEDIRYDTFRDLKDGNKLVSDHSTWGNEWNLTDEGPVDSTVFTYFPAMKKIAVEDGELRVKLSPVILPEEESGLSALRSDIVDYFERVITGERREPGSGADWRNAPGAVTAEELYELLADFYDDDFDPWDPEKVSVEAVPMVNEIYLRENNAYIEVWQPYVGDDSQRYEDGFEIELDIGAANSVKNVGRAERNIPNEYEPIPPQTYIVNLTQPITNTVDNLVVTITGANGQEFDRVDFGSLSTSIDLETSWQCNDPRFNHLASQWTQGSAHTLNRVNTAVASYRDNASNPAALGYVADGDYMMYCANAPLRSTGELGYLPVAPWRTLKLYQDPRDTRAGVQSMDPVLDYFTMTPTNTVRFGSVNPNIKFDSHGSLLGPVLGIDNWDDKGCWRLYEDDESYDSFGPVHPRKHIRFSDNIFHRMRSAKNEFMNISDVGRRIFHSPKLSEFKNSSDVLRYNELRFEDPMRRHSALAHVGGQVYTVLMWGQALGEGQGNDWKTYPVLSEAQAVGMVWRDPYPDASGKHRKFVRFIRWFE